MIGTLMARIAHLENLVIRLFARVESLERRVAAAEQQLAQLGTKPQ